MAFQDLILLHNRRFTRAVAVGSAMIVAFSAPTYGQAPVADSGGPYSIEYGSLLSLDGSGSFHPNPFHTIVSYDWDLGNDGIFDVSGVSYAMTAVEYDALLGSIDLFTPYDLMLRVRDDNAPTLSGTELTTVTFIPEPGTVALLAFGGCLMVCRRRGDRSVY